MLPCGAQCAGLHQVHSNHHWNVQLTQSVRLVCPSAPDSASINGQSLPIYKARPRVRPAFALDCSLERPVDAVEDGGLNRLVPAIACNGSGILFSRVRRSFSPHLAKHYCSATLNALHMMCFCCMVHDCCLHVGHASASCEISQ